MITPALRRLALDRGIGARAIRVYAYVAPSLDFVEYRPVKLLSVAREMSMHRSGVSRAMRHLTEEGYLARNGRDGPRGPWKYRLTYSVSSK